MKRRVVTFFHFLLFSDLKSSSVKNGSMLFNRISYFCSHTNDKKIPFTHSFLQPTVFAAVKPSPRTQSQSPSTPVEVQNNVDTSLLVTELEIALDENRLNDAWKAFKSLRNNGALPTKNSINKLVNKLSSAGDLASLKRAFATIILLLEKAHQTLLDMESITNLVSILERANLLAPASTLIKTMLKSGYYPNLGLWGPVVDKMSKVDTVAHLALEILDEVCRLVLEKDDKLVDQMRPDISAVNSALHACLTLGSVGQAESLLQIITGFGLRADGRSFGLIAQLYAKQGLKEKLVKLDKVMDQYRVTPDKQFYSSLARAYLSVGDLESASEVLLMMLESACDCHVDQVSLESGGKCSRPEVAALPDEQIYCVLVKGFLKEGTTKDVAKFVIKAQEVEGKSMDPNQTVDIGVIRACVNLGWLDKAHSILDEMNACGCKVGVGAYCSLLKAYCKEQRTAEATQLVSDVNRAGLELDAASYDAVIDVCMTAQDFKAAFALFREMREAGVGSLRTSYLTIMTGLTENHRPELMAAFLDEVVVDSQIEVGVHDWNSIIHSFCKLGRLEDARRTFKRMAFLHFEPNAQTYLSLVHGYCAAEKYFSVLLTWSEMKKRMVHAEARGIEALKINRDLIDAFLFSLVKGGFFDAAMEVVEKMQELKIFVDKWRYKHVYLETHKKLKLARLRKKNFRKAQGIIAFKNWVGLSHD